jgi:hypothetical protein
MSNQRLIEVVEDIERSILEIIRKHHVTHDEYRLVLNQAAFFDSWFLVGG